jgi:hypothetical protein
MTTADAPSSHKARQRLVLRLAELGVPTADVDRQRHVVAVWTRGRAQRRSELTEAEAGSLYARLREMGPDDLAGVLAMTKPEPVTSPAVEAATAALAETIQAAIDLDAQTLPAGAIACGSDQLTEHDAAQVRAFAEFLEQAGPAPSPTPPHGGTCPCDPCNPDPPEEDAEPDAEPAAAATVEDGPAPADSGPGQRPGTRDGDDPGEVADHRPAGPAPVIEPPARTPEEVEAAALAAVERFHARAGAIPEAPDPTARPPRVPQLVEPAADRYCMVRCYCGTCPDYPAQHEAAERTYRQELTAARNKDLRA